MTELALVIEDDIDLSEVFVQAFRAAGFETKAVLDGLVAQETIPTLTPDVVVLDIHLPNVPGDVLLRQIRADKRLDKTFVVVVTSDALMGEQLRPIANFVFIKPTTFAQLRDLARRLRREK
jgi:DNA-binding response OmpR family regulator